MSSAALISSSVSGSSFGPYVFSDVWRPPAPSSAWTIRAGSVTYSQTSGTSWISRLFGAATAGFGGGGGGGTGAVATAPFGGGTGFGGGAAGGADGFVAGGAGGFAVVVAPSTRTTA